MSLLDIESIQRGWWPELTGRWVKKAWSHCRSWQVGYTVGASGQVLAWPGELG